MIIPGKTFPYTPLRPRDQKWISDLCGGNPLRDPEYLQNFLRISGVRFLATSPRRQLFNDIAWRSVGALEVEPIEKAVRVFNRGLLFYAGVTCEISNTPEMPYEEPVMSKIVDENPRDLALDGYQRINELESFRVLLGMARPAMEAEDNSMYQVALAGAGVLHRALTESVELRHDTIPESITTAHPELADLQKLFDTLPLPESE